MNTLRMESIERLRQKLLRQHNNHRAVKAVVPVAAATNYIETRNGDVIRRRPVNR